VTHLTTVASYLIVIAAVAGFFIVGLLQGRWHASRNRGPRQYGAIWLIPAAFWVGLAAARLAPTIMGWRVSLLMALYFASIAIGYLNAPRATPGAPRLTHDLSAKQL
jgi:hypothetical protein